jgi:hypothetical protein
MQKHDIDDVKISFVLSVYETIQNQIRQADLKISLILSWVSITAVLLGREVASVFGTGQFHVLPIILVTIAVIGMIFSGVFIFGTLKPRTKPLAGLKTKGLLYTGDIVRLAEEPIDRVKAYMEEITAIKTHEEVYAQFVASIVSISDIAQVKNRMFLRALAATAVSFAALVGLVAEAGLMEKLLK